MSNREIREALIATTRAVTMKVNFNMMHMVVECTMTSRMRDLVREECYMAMVHDNMTIARHTVYAQLIEESNLTKMPSNLKRSVDSDQVRPRFKKGVQT